MYKEHNVTKHIALISRRQQTHLSRPIHVMVLLGLLGDVHKGNFTWHLKAFDEFQSLLNLPVRFEAGFFFQSAEFSQISLNYKFPVRFP